MPFIQRRETDRKWAHCFVVTGTQLHWDFRFCLWSNRCWISFFSLAKLSVRCFPLNISTLLFLFLLLLRLLVFVLTCSLFLPSTLTRLWGTALFLSSQVVDEGGIQRQSAAWLGGLGSLGGSLVLFPLHCRLFFPFSWGFSRYLLSVTTSTHTWTDWQQGKAILLGFTQTSVFLSLFQHYHLTKNTSLTEWHASAWFKQQTHGMWVWDRVPALTGRGCLASYSNLNVLMV